MHKVGQAIEILRVKVQPENIEQFITQRKNLDDLVSQLKGFVSTEMIQINSEEWLVLIRWEDEITVKDAQTITSSMPEIQEWITKNTQFISFQTGLVNYGFTK